jgi:diguanylate cyclase (GGDEF)-like protein
MPKRNRVSTTREGSAPGRAALIRLVVAVAVGCGGLLLAAGLTLSSLELGMTGALGLVVLIGAAALAEAFPVPLEGVSAGGVSLAAVFITGSGVLFGWQAAAAAGLLCRGSIELVKRRPPIRFVYNSATYALAGAAAGGAAGLFGRDTTVAESVLQVILATTAFYAVNVGLVAIVVSVAERERLSAVAARSTACTALPFAIMASVTLILDVLWARTPLLLLALVGPLLAVALYQRSTHRALAAMRLALTDPVTGLGNHRHFHESLTRMVNAAEATGMQLALCMLDIDDLKSLNDRYGHPLGDRVLAQIAAQLRRSGEAFRLGGDEFALLLPGVDEGEAITIAEKVLRRLATAAYEHGGPVGASCGVAVLPSHGTDPTALIEVADTALYWAKAEGKNQVKAYASDLAALARVADANVTDREAGMRAAASLARAIDERDVYTGAHSNAVGELAARIARRLGLDPELVELVRLAGRLHDLGKLAVPENILRKPHLLTEIERTAIRRHPQIAFRMLESVGLGAVADWVLHHHERWDGTGYPDGLAGERIPLGSRIIFVADAYDAMTTQRIYRDSKLTSEAAVAEVQACAGTQFDPRVVDALVAELEVRPADPVRPVPGLRAAAR